MSDPGAFKRLPTYGDVAPADPTPDLAAETLVWLNGEAGNDRYIAQLAAHAAQCVKAAMTPVAWGVLCAGKVLTGVICHSEDAARKWIKKHAAVKYVCSPVPLFALATGGDDGK